MKESLGGCFLTGLKDSLTLCKVFLEQFWQAIHDLGAMVLKALYPLEVLDLGMTRALYCPLDLSDLVGVYSLIISLRYFGAYRS